MCRFGTRRPTRRSLDCSSCTRNTATKRTVKPNNLAILYKIVTIAAPNSEESHYNLGCIATGFTRVSRTRNGSQIVFVGKDWEILEMKGRTVRSLIESLKYGVNTRTNSLPLLLNIWLDLGTELAYSNESRQKYCSPLCETPFPMLFV